MKKSYPLLIALLSSLLCISQAFAQKNKSIRGNGVIKKETRELDRFHGVKVGGAFDVEIKKGNTHEAVIEADENLMSHIKMEVKDNILHIKMNGWVKKVNKLNVSLVMRDMESLSASGASDVVVHDMFEANEFNLNGSGAADISLKVQAEKLKVNLSGSSDVEINGEAEEMFATLSGAVDLDADNFPVEDININSSGSSSAHIHASRELKAMASGSSDINCEGNPSSKSVKSSGAADIQVD